MSLSLIKKHLYNKAVKKLSLDPRWHVTSQGHNHLHTTASGARQQQWIQFIFNECPGHVSADLYRTVCVCTVHFTTDCFENNSQYNTCFAQKRLLKDQAVPTVLESARTPQTVSNVFHF